MSLVYAILIAIGAMPATDPSPAPLAMPAVGDSGPPPVSS